MSPTSSQSSAPRVKICCIASVEEAALAVACGASALGLVSHMPSGPGVIGDELIAEIAATVPPAVGTFLLTCRQSVADIVKQQRFCRTNTIQICDHLTRGTHRELKDALPGISVVQVIHVTGPESVDEALKIAPHVDAILLDSGNQKLAVKELGGTGRTHDWSLSGTIRERIIREGISVPMFLAGGLTPENVAHAIEAVGPFGLDVCSGVRTDGRLDAIKLRRFFSAIAAVGPALPK
jgi:phosphoribosylanthranilate isomerase